MNLADREFIVPVFGNHSGPVKGKAEIQRYEDELNERLNEDQQPPSFHPEHPAEKWDQCEGEKVFCGESQIKENQVPRDALATECDDGGSKLQNAGFGRRILGFPIGSQVLRPDSRESFFTTVPDRGRHKTMRNATISQRKKFHGNTA